MGEVLELFSAKAGASPELDSLVEMAFTLRKESGCAFAEPAAASIAAAKTADEMTKDRVRGIQWGMDMLDLIGVDSRCLNRSLVLDDSTVD